MLVLWRRLQVLWRRTHVSQHGQYSVERLAALETYCRTRSLMRVLLVLLLTPCPVVILIGAFELVPLQDPSEGWTGNSVFWARVCVALMLLCEGAIRHAQHIIPELPITAWQRFGIGLATTTAYTGTLMIVADQWVFPVPFTLAVGAAPCSTVFIVLFALAVGKQSLRTTPLLRERLKQFAGVVNINMSMLILYPAYNAVFTSMPDRFRYIFVAVMPATRLTLVNLTANCCDYWPDLIPVTAVFIVETFNALFVAMFMQNSGRVLTMAVVLMFDALLLARSLYHIRRRLSSVRRLFQHVKTSTSAMPTDLIAAVRWLCLSPNELPGSARGLLRIFDSRPLSFNASADIANSLSKLQGSGTRVMSRSMASNARFAQVLPSSETAALRNAWSPSAIVPGQARAQHSGRTEFVQDTLKLLFHCEYVMLAAYVKCFVPLIYVVTQSVLHSLPNAKYYPYYSSAEAATFDSIIGFVSMYGGLEIVLLLVIHVVLRGHWGFGPLYQLAFTLESHMTVVQSTLLTSTGIVYQFSLIHLGADFSFKFPWIHEKASATRPPAV